MTVSVIVRVDVTMTVIITMSVPMTVVVSMTVTLIISLFFISFFMLSDDCDFLKELFQMAKNVFKKFKFSRLILNSHLFYSP